MCADLFGAPGHGEEDEGVCGRGGVDVTLKGYEC